MEVTKDALSQKLRRSCNSRFLARLPPLLRISGERNPDVTKQGIEMCSDDMKQLYLVLGRGKSLKSKLWLYSF
jgi:hypothetical protein